MNKGVAGYEYLYDLNSRTNTVFAMYDNLVKSNHKVTPSSK